MKLMSADFQADSFFDSQLKQTFATWNPLFNVKKRSFYTHFRHLILMTF